MIKLFIWIHRFIQNNDAQPPTKKMDVQTYERLLSISVLVKQSRSSFHKHSLHK